MARNIRRGDFGYPCQIFSEQPGIFNTKQNTVLGKNGSVSRIVTWLPSRLQILGLKGTFKVSGPKLNPFQSSPLLWESGQG